MKQKWIQSGCFAAFLIVCLGVAAFLHIFMQGVDELRFVEWDSAVFTDINGKKQPQNLDELIQTGNPGQDTNGFWSFSTVLDSVEDGDNLAFELYGSEISILLDGKEMLSTIPKETGMGLTQIQIPLSPQNNGQTLTMTYMPVFSEGGIFPPSPRLLNPMKQSVADIAYAGFYDIPASVFAVITILIWGLFLLGIVSHKPNFSLLLILCASTILTMRDILMGLGYYFSVNEKLCSLFGSAFFSFLPAIMLLVYMLLNRQQAFRRLFGIAVIGSVAAFLAAYLISFAGNGTFSGHVSVILKDFFLYHSYQVPLYWLTGWLVVLCTTLSALHMIQTIAGMQAESQALTQKNKLIMENYYTMEQGITQTRTLRHEMKAQLAALTIMYRQGNMEEMGQYLEELTKQQDNLAQLQFTNNFTINTILQNVAYRCSQKGIEFRTDILVPETLSIPEGDLCSLLINALDNAIEAAEQTLPDQKPYILMQLKVKQGFLTVYCENSYNGRILKNEKGEFLSMKKDFSSHGFGIKQMSAVAKRYHSLLDVNGTDEKFVLRTALKLPGENQN